VFDVAGNRNFREVQQALTPKGRFVTTEPGLRAAVLTLFSKACSRHATMILARPKQRDLAELIRLYEAGQLRVTLADVLPLEQAAEAQRRLKAGGHCGKYVLQVTQS
jgi:NADPH:quinone reductase-like Zn-dependent oxidoreductase